MPFRHGAFVLLLSLACGICASRAAQADGMGIITGPARVEAVAPSAGFRTGGTRVTIYGANFVPPIHVWLGHASCGGVEFRSPSELDCITSSHSVGTVDLLVKTPRAFIIKRKVFTYVPDLSLAPDVASVVQGGATSFTASGGLPPYRFSVIKGMSVIDSTSGKLQASATPEVGIVRVTDSAGHSTEAGYRVLFPLSIFPESPSTFPDRAVIITAYGGAPPYQYRIVSGAGRFIPDKRTFVASSSPGTAVVRVSDSLQDSRDLTITVKDLPTIPPHVIAVGDGYSCAAPTGAVSCWGSNGYQQLGDYRERSVDVSTPMEALSSGVISIVSGMHHSCVLVSGGVKCWGGNEYGQLGDGTNRPSASPRQVIGLESGVLAISAGDFHTCAILANSAVCWGRNESGQLGDGTATQSSLPVAVRDLEGRITAIGAGASHTCAVVDGAAKCWGRNRNGQLGIGNRVDQWTPVAVQGLSSDVQAISAGRAHTCAATSSSLKCWGFNGTGNLGASTAADKSKPYEVQIQTPVSDLASRQYHSCAIASGQLYCWGYNYQGEVGDSSYLNRWAPVHVSGFDGAVRDVATANFHSCAVSEDNQVYCWGDDYFGELGDGGSSRQTAPVRVITEQEKRRLRREQADKIWRERKQRKPEAPVREKSLPGDSLQ